MSFLLCTIFTIGGLIGFPYLFLNVLPKRIVSDKEINTFNNDKNYAIDRYEKNKVLEKEHNLELYGHERPLEHLYLKQCEKWDNERGL